MALTDVFAYHSSLVEESRPTKLWRLGAWLWATQGNFLVAVRDDGSDADATPDKMLKGARYLDETPADARTVSLAELRAFAGPVQSADDPCADCNGDGYSEWDETIECEHCGAFTRQECRRCGGDGLAAITVRDGLVCGVPVNLVLLAYALTQVPDDSIVTIGTLRSVGNSELNTGQALAVVGADWRVVLMCVREVPLGTRSFPALASARSESAVDPSGRSEGTPSTRV